MKPIHFLPLLLGVSLMLSAIPVAAQDAGGSLDDVDTTQSSGTGGTNNTGATGEQHGRILAQLNLTDEQKAQIKQIRASTTDKKERRQEVMAVLTPEQKAQLKELIEQRRAQREAAASQTNN